MNPQQEEKLQQLIKASSIFNPQEQAEWLGLLGLMNDKQLGELEKILGPEQSENRRIGESEVGNQGAIKKQEPILNSGTKSQMPKLSHIVNLPRIEAIDEKSEIRNPKSEIQPEKQKLSFGQRLKSILAEKELTTGKPGAELELPEGKHEPKAERQVRSSFVSDFAKAMSDKKAMADKPQVLAKSPVRLPLPPVPKPPLNKVAKPSLSADKPESVRPQISQQVVQPVFTPMASYTNPEKPKQDSLKSFEDNLLQNKTPLHLQPDAPKGSAKPEVKLETMDDLKVLNVKILQDGDFDSIVKKVKNLTAKYGYNEVVFNLEKSPLFNSYIQTGWELLSKQTSFESLAVGIGEKSYLNRREFEKIADLLLQIQAG